uniref:Uncharacterized protein n=5 Tax=Bactrocera latifrons TaxID=174628 RepID=A0A0K8UYR5_BACLA
MQPIATCASTTTTKSSPASSNRASLTTATTFTPQQAEIRISASPAKSMETIKMLESSVAGQNWQLKQRVVQKEQAADLQKQQEQYISTLKLNQKQQSEQEPIIDAPLAVAADILITSNSHKSKATTKCSNIQEMTNAKPTSNPNPSSSTITLTRTKPVEQPKISSANKHIYNPNYNNNNNNNNNNQSKNIPNISNTNRNVNTKNIIVESSNINVHSVSAKNTSSSNKNNSNGKSLVFATYEESNNAVVKTQPIIQECTVTTTKAANLTTATTTKKPRALGYMHVAERNAINLNSFTDFVRKTTTIAKDTTTKEETKFGRTYADSNESNNDDDVGDDTPQPKQQQHAIFGNSNNNTQSVSKVYNTTTATAVLGRRAHAQIPFCSPTSVSSGSEAEHATMSTTTKIRTPSSTATRRPTNAIQKHLRRFELEI